MKRAKVKAVSASKYNGNSDLARKVRSGEYKIVASDASNGRATSGGFAGAARRASSAFSS